MEIGDLRPERDDPTGAEYWRREADAYDSGLLDDLGDGLVAPRCYLVDEDGPQIALWLEDLPDQGPAMWSLERFETAALHLGRFNGRYLGDRALPAHPWLSHGRIREWLADAEPRIGATRTRRRAGFLTAWLSDASIDRIERLARSRPVRPLRGGRSAYRPQGAHGPSCVSA